MIGLEEVLDSSWWIPVPIKVSVRAVAPGLCGPRFTQTSSQNAQTAACGDPSCVLGGFVCDLKARGGQVAARLLLCHYLACNETDLLQLTIC